MATEIEKIKGKSNTAYIACVVSALIFFAGLIIVLANVNEQANGIGVVITGIGGLFLLISYLVMKYTGYKVKTFDDGGW